MLLTHLHLMLNHLPVFGSVVLFFLMVHAVLYKKEKQVKIFLWFYVLVAILAIPVFLTGDPAGELIKKIPGITESSIDTHETFGYISLIIILSLGASAAAAIRFFKNKEFLPSWFKYFFLIVAFFSVLAVSWTGKTGGDIRHSEITTELINSK